MSDKPLDCVGISDIGKTITGKHDFKERPLSPLDVEFMRMMTETTGCKFVDVTDKTEQKGGAE